MIYGVSAVDLHNDAMIIKSTPLCRGAFVMYVYCIL